MPRSVVLLSAITAVLMAVPAWSADRDISELFDPAVIARNMCGANAQARAALPPQQLAQLAESTKAGERPPLWPGLGTLSFKISTANPEAQAYFDQGLRLTYGFNRGEALRAFRAAQELDPTCAMCVWGEALDLGPNINGPMEPDANTPAMAALQRAQALMTPQTPAKERALIEALGTRYTAKPPKNRDKLDVAYAEAMKKVYQSFPDDPDVAIAFIEASMVAATEWFDRNNAPVGRVAEAMAAAEHALARDPNHAGAIHYYIHLAEVPKPEAVEPYADKLAALMPGAGHMVHMPSHIFLRLGRYKESLSTNLAAVEVDAAYLAAVPDAAHGYRYGLYPHNINMAMWSASMAGDGKTALALAAKLAQSLSADDWSAEYLTVASYSPILRFEDPAAVLARPAPSAKMDLATGAWRYARGSAAAWTGDLRTARAEVNALRKLRVDLIRKHGKRALGDSAGQMELAETVLQARVAIADGNLERAKNRLERAVKIQDDGWYYRGDPPASEGPLRHELGLLLMKMGRPADAIPILRQALIDTPNSAWTLYALKEASVRVGDTLGAQEYGKLFEKAWAGEGVPDLSRI